MDLKSLQEAGANYSHDRLESYLVAEGKAKEHKAAMELFNQVDEAATAVIEHFLNVAHYYTADTERKKSFLIPLPGTTEVSGWGGSTSIAQQRLYAQVSRDDEGMSATITFFHGLVTDPGDELSFPHLDIVKDLVLPPGGSKGDELAIDVVELLNLRETFNLRFFPYYDRKNESHEMMEILQVQGGTPAKIAYWRIKYSEHLAQMLETWQLISEGINTQNSFALENIEAFAKKQSPH